VFVFMSLRTKTSVVASCQFRLESRKRRTFDLAAPHRGSRARMSSELFRTMLAGIGSGPCQSSRVTSRETHFRAQMTMKIELAAEITRILRPDDEARPSSRASSLGNAIRVSRRNYARSLFDCRYLRPARIGCFSSSGLREPSRTVVNRHKGAGSGRWRRAGNHEALGICRGGGRKFKTSVILSAWARERASISLRSRGERAPGEVGRASG